MIDEKTSISQQWNQFYTVFSKIPTVQSQRRSGVVSQGPPAPCMLAELPAVDTGSSLWCVGYGSHHPQSAARHLTSAHLLWFNVQRGPHSAHKRYFWSVLEVG